MKDVKDMTPNEKLDLVLALTGEPPIEAWNSVQSQSWIDGKLVGPCGTNSHLQINEICVSFRSFAGMTIPEEGSKEHGIPVAGDDYESQDIDNMTYLVCYCPECCPPKVGRGRAFMPPPEVWELMEWCPEHGLVTEKDPK